MLIPQPKILAQISQALEPHQGRIWKGYKTHTCEMNLPAQTALFMGNKVKRTQFKR